MYHIQGSEMTKRQIEVHGQLSQTNRKTEERDKGMDLSP